MTEPRCQLCGEIMRAKVYKPHKGAEHRALWLCVRCDLKPQPPVQVPR